MAHGVAVVVCGPGGLATGVIAIPLDMVKGGAWRAGEIGCTWLFVPLPVVV